MAVNSIFHTNNKSSILTERNLYKDLIKEAIQIYGHDVYYVDRTLVARDNVLGEDALSKFTNAQPIEMYVEDSEGFGGDKEIITQFGLENRNDITFVVSIQNTNVANTLVMIATAPMLSAILGAIFLKEPPDKKTWISIIITFLAIIYIFYDSLKLGNFYGDILGFVTAIGLAVGAVIIRSAKNKNLVPAAVVCKLFVATFALLFIESFALVGKDLLIVPLMCILCVAIPFVLVTIAPRFIPAAEVNLFFLLETIIGPIWVWLIIKEQPSLETLQGGLIIITTIAIHSYLKLKNS